MITASRSIDCVNAKAVLSSSTLVCETLTTPRCVLVSYLSLRNLNPALDSPNDPANESMLCSIVLAMDLAYLIGFFEITSKTTYRLRSLSEGSNGFNLAISY